MTHHTDEKFSVILKQFQSAGFQADKILGATAGSHLIVRGAKPFDDRFVTLNHGCDFRDGDWSVTISLGFGFPEKANDPVEFQFSSISTVDLKIAPLETGYLAFEIENKELFRLFYTSVAYSLAYLGGTETTIIEQIKQRNRRRLAKPLISSGNPGFDLTRNAELEDLLQKYL